MKILDLPLKKEWYNMIERGEKLEEYREINPYWIKRLCRSKGNCDWCGCCEISLCINMHISTNYTHVRFRFGYTKRTMLFEIDKIIIGRGNSKWGAPNRDVFIIKLKTYMKSLFYDK